jgi:hypothetical protein
MTADYVKRGRGATIGYMDQFDASHGLEQLASHVRCRASVERSHADFAWICLGERNELGNRPGGRDGLMIITRGNQSTPLFECLHSIGKLVKPEHDVRTHQSLSSFDKQISAASSR